MAKARSAKGLFKATKRKQPRDRKQLLLMKTREMRAPKKHNDRHPEDFYATACADAIRSLLVVDGDRIRECGSIWENAVGAGAIAREIQHFGLPVVGSDIVDRGWPGVIVKSFYEFTSSPCRGIITNPPFKEMTARDGHGRWLRHLLSLSEWDYLALLLNWTWPASTMNGFGALLTEHQFSYAYLLRFRLDFDGGGSPPQTNGWFVWDRRHHGPSEFRLLDRADFRQAQLL